MAEARALFELTDPKGNIIAEVDAPVGTSAVDLYQQALSQGAIKQEQIPGRFKAIKEPSKSPEPVDDAFDLGIDDVIGAAELGLTAISAVPSEVLALGIAGFDQIIGDDVPEQDRLQRFSGIQSAVRDATLFIPKTKTGQEIISRVAEPFELLREGRQSIGEFIFELSDSPLAATATETGLVALANFLPFKLARKPGLAGATVAASTATRPAVTSLSSAVKSVIKPSKPLTVQEALTTSSEAPVKVFTPATKSAELNIPKVVNESAKAIEKQSELISAIAREYETGFGPQRPRLNSQEATQFVKKSGDTISAEVIANEVTKRGNITDIDTVIPIKPVMNRAKLSGIQGTTARFDPETIGVTAESFADLRNSIRSTGAVKPVTVIYDNAKDASTWTVAKGRDNLLAASLEGYANVPVRMIKRGSTRHAEWIETSFNSTDVENIGAALLDTLEGRTLDTSPRLFQALAEEVKSLKIEEAQVPGLIDRFGGPQAIGDMAIALKNASSESGKILNRLSQLNESISFLARHDPRIAEIFKQAGLGKAFGSRPETALEKVSRFWRKSETARRIAMVSQMATQAANSITFGLTMSMHGFESLAKGAVQAGSLSFRGRFGDAHREVGAAINTFALAQTQVVPILAQIVGKKVVGKQQAKTFMDALGPISEAQLGGPSAFGFNMSSNAYSNILTVIPRWFETNMRSAAYNIKMRELLLREGLDPDTITPQNIPKRIVRESVQFGLEKAFAAAPTSRAGKAIVEITRAFPPLSIAFPFARFQISALRWILQNSPAAAYNVAAGLSPRNTKIIARAEKLRERGGKFSIQEKAVLKEAASIEGQFADGVGKLATWYAGLQLAMKLQENYGAGRWDEFVIDQDPESGELDVFNIDSFHPLTAYAFQAAVLNEYLSELSESPEALDQLRDIWSNTVNERGTNAAMAETGIFLRETFPSVINKFGTRDVLKAFVGINRIPGMDVVFAGGPEGLMKNLSEIAGSYFGSFATPGQMVRDAIILGNDISAGIIDTYELETNPTFKKLDLPTADMLRGYAREQAIQRQIDGTSIVFDLTAPIKANLAIPRTTLPERADVSLGAPVEEQLFDSRAARSAFKQGLGIRGRQKSFLLDEADRLGIPRSAWFVKTGREDLDNEATRHSGAIFRQISKMLFNSAAWANMDHSERRLLLNGTGQGSSSRGIGLIGAVKRAGKVMAITADDPDIRQQAIKEILENQLSEDYLQFLDSKGIRLRGLIVDYVSLGT